MGGETAAGQGRRATQAPTWRPCNGQGSWHVNETYLKVLDRWNCLHSAINRDRNLIDAMLSETGDKAAMTFFGSAMVTMGSRPDRVTTDEYSSYPGATHSMLERGLAPHQRLPK